MKDHSTTAPSTWGRNLRQPEAAEFMGMSQATFRRRAKEPGFPAALQVSPRIRVYRELDLVHYLQRLAAGEEVAGRETA